MLALPASGKSPLDGTWTGTSTCVGNRPACKNEVVVYRFVPIKDDPGRFRQLADKIIEGKRVPMAVLDCDFDERTGTVRSEFRVGNTHGVWTFTVKGDTMTGELIILPEGSRGRDVKAHRVKDTDVPPAPADKEYEE